MKHMKKLIVAALAVVTAVALCVPALAFAATADSGKGGNASITITLPTDNAGTDEEITYTVYKVFAATSDGASDAIAYQIDSVNGNLTTAMTDAGFRVDAAGNVSGPNGSQLSANAISAIAAYAQDSIGTFKAKPSDGTLKITGLEYGYYYISTTTGSAVTVDSTNPNATVSDKNDIPASPNKTIVDGDDFEGSLDEAGKNALAQVGTTVHFKVEIKKVKGATNYVFHDKMTTGLSYNNDVAVNPATIVANTDTADGDTVTVTFDNAKLAALADNTTITITYSATVTSDALSVDPENNTATLDYGDGHTTDKDQVKVYNAKFTVTKNQPANEGEEGAVLNEADGKYYKPLNGAGFVIKNAAGKYYKLADNHQSISWVDNIDEATEYKSDATGAVSAFTGLADGTYTLVEKTVPAGYNKAADSTFTIAAGDVTVNNLVQAKTVTNQSGTELPSTGGIGTTIFYVIGGILIAVAAIFLITRKRVANARKEDEEI